MKMTILPQIRQNTEDNEESQQNSPANQQISLELNLAPARVAHVAHGLENELETPSKRRLRKRFREQNREKEIEIEIVDKPKSPILQPLATTSEEETGFNSEDEYEEHPRKKYTDEEWRQRDFEFARSLEKLGFTIKPMTEDGACLFRAIADQVYGDQTMHSVVRKHCMDYILKNRDFFCSYITEDINKYVNRKRQDSVHGNHLEIQAMSEMFHRTVEVYSYQLKPINIFHQRSDYEPIRLSYERASHYNSIVNPHNSTIGVGLGLSTEKHNELLLEQAMLEDKMKTTDWEATNEMIEEQVAKESYLQWCKDNEKRKIQLTNSTAGSSSTNTSCLDASGVGGLTPIGKALDKSGTKLLDTGKKWSQWSPLGAFVSTKNEKKRTVDDTHIDNGEVKFVSLRSHDFTGLGFNICGNMRDGIYIKDVLHRGPASESGKLNPGDRINSVRISFEHMVYEDALTILSYASPYAVEVEAKSCPKGHHQGPPGSGGQGAQPKHPLFRSSSSSDLVKIGKSARKGLFLQGDMDTSPTTDYSTLQLSSNNTTMERGRKSPQSDVNSLTKPERVRKPPVKNLSPEQLKSQLEQNLAQKISHGDMHPKHTNKMEAEKQTSEVDNKNKFQKFGVRVLPMESKPENTQQRSPKSSELSQNDNNINQERQLEHSTSVPEGRDEVDKTKVMNGEAPPVKRREKKNGDLPREVLIEAPKEPENFVRQNSLNGSGIKRDKAGIPQEIPDHMLQAAVAARKNRKSTEIVEKTGESDENETAKTPKKQKGKAPAPPPGQTKPEPRIEPEKDANLRTSNNRLNFTDNFDEISTLEEKEQKKEKPTVNQTDDNISDMKPEVLAEKLTDDTKEYCSDSDMETDNQSSVNTIELNSSDITIHHAEQDADIKGRKTASTGDLSKIQKGRRSNTGTLERAQSLDITDSGIPTLTKKRKATKDDLDSKLSSDESLYEASNLKVKEPRLSLALDGLDTFQRNRLKKSSEWGNLEDVIMNLDKVEPDDLSSSTDEKISYSEKSPTKFDFGMKDSTFGNTVTNLNDVHITLVSNDIEEKTAVKNVIWPVEDNMQDKQIEKETILIAKPQIVDKKDKVATESTDFSNIKINNVLWPLSDSEKSKEDVETSHSINIQQTIVETSNTDLNKEIELPVSSSPKSVSKTEITESSSEKITQKPPLPESGFSLKAQFQEKLNSKLNQNETNQSTAKIVNNTSTSYSKPLSDTFHPGKSSQNFIFAEKYASNNDDHYLPSKLYDTNVSDDIKVSRHSLGSLERPKSDVLKNVNKLKMQNLISSDQGGVSNVTITEMKPRYENGYTVTTTDNHELKTENSNYDMSTASELYTTAIDSTVLPEDPMDTNIGIKNITITETITDSKYITDSPSSLTIDTSSDGPESIKSNTLTFVTEIQVSTPPNSNQNVSEIEVNTDSKQNSPQQSYTEPEENLKKLPEMKFSTSSYESPKTPEKRLSQIELLRSNFEKSPPKPSKPIDISPSKSRIPVATKIDFKMSPERREIDTDEKEIVEIMSSAIHSTPVVSNQRYGNSANKTTAKNVTVTSIRTSSKIPSGSHITYSNKPPVPAKPDHSEIHDTRTVSANGSTDSAFKQWVFNPSESSVTNIVVNNNKESHK